MYIDTSSLVAFYVHEELSQQVHKFITSAEKLVISSITKVELLSAVNKKVRMGFLSRNEARIAFQKFEEHTSKGFYKLLKINTDHYKMAIELLLQTKSALRILDAIHLGIVQQERIAIASNDRILLQSAKEFNIPTIDV